MVRKRTVVLPLVRTVCALLTLGMVSACSLNGTPPTGTPPKVARTLPVTKQLMLLPPPERVVDVGVYSFPDLTGQNKPGENFANFSKAVTQGASAYLTEALLRAGQGSWFSVTERSGLNNLLQERRIIRGTREEYEGKGNGLLPPLRFAGIMLEGGVIAYDSNVRTGGIGARWLGIGSDIQYRRDIVTVALRAVSVSTGKVLAAVSTTKTVYSIAARTNVFRFIAVDEILDADAGFSINEPPQLAVRQAVELAVYSLVLEGALNGLWSFEDKRQARGILKRFIETRYDGFGPGDLLGINEKFERATNPNFGMATVEMQGVEVVLSSPNGEASAATVRDNRLPKLF